MWNVVFEWKNKELWKMNPRLVGYFRQDSGSAEWPQQLLSAYGLDGVLCALRALNNCYAGAWVVEDTLYLAADHVRSIPIYYSIRKDSVYVSDDAVYLARKLGLPIDAGAKKEFENAGFVGNEKTLFRGIAATQAGVLTAVNLRENLVSQLQHFSLLNTFETLGNEDEFDKLMVQVFKEIVESLNGKTVLLALSGGHDSRAIATMLRRLNYEHVICYSYGSPKSGEMEISKSLAKALHYPWYPVSSTTKEMREFRKSEEWSRASIVACHGDSYHAMTDAVVFQKLQQNPAIPQDCVCMPGHNFEDSLDVVWDDCMKDFVFESTMVRNWYSMRKATALTIEQCMDKFPYYLPLESVEEKAAGRSLVCKKDVFVKFHCNNTRLIELAGYSWRLPLCDRRLVAYFNKIQARDTYDRNFWYRYTEKYIKPFSQQVPYFDSVTESHHGMESHKKWKNRVPDWMFSLSRKLYYAFSQKSGFSKIPSNLERICAVLIRGSLLSNYYLVQDTLCNVEEEVRNSE